MDLEMLRMMRARGREFNCCAIPLARGDGAFVQFLYFKQRRVKSMKRKILSILLTTAVATMLLIGCGGSEDEGSKEDNINSSVSQESNVNEKEDMQEEEKSEMESYIVSGNEVAYEDEYITLEISEVQRSAVSSSVSITVSNKTDQSLGIYPQKWTINGFCVKPDTFGYIDIGPNEENVVSEVILPIEKLEAIGISNVGELALQCDLRDASEDMLGDNVIYSVLVGYQTTDYANMDTEISVEPDEIGECEGVKLYAAIVPNGFYSWANTAILFMAENTNSETVNVSMADESDDVAIRSLTGAIASDETFVLGLWGTDDVSVGDAVKLYVTLLNENNEEILVDRQEFEWIAK